jgi:hypothetical protein
MQGVDAEISEIVREFFFCSWNGAESWEEWIICIVGSKMIIKWRVSFTVGMRLVR